MAYYRGQKWIEGQLNQQGRWYGTAIVLGYVGRNLVIAHRKHIFRCAPEQVRFATSEEKALLNTPQIELLGIKDLIEGGAFKSQQSQSFLEDLKQSFQFKNKASTLGEDHFGRSNSSLVALFLLWQPCFQAAPNSLLTQFLVCQLVFVGFYLF